MEVVAVEYDEDSIDKAQELTEKILKENEVLDGIICCNMSNPVGAARAIKASGRDVVIVGMDHDREALQDLRDGVIYCLGVQDCYSMGFDTIQVAVKIADGVAPGDLYPETTEESTTIIYQKDAETMLKILFGEMG
jgi:ribose transport system substrate-binding protein